LSQVSVYDSLIGHPG